MFLYPFHAGPLPFNQIYDEKIKGIASNTNSTSKSHESGTRGPKANDINSRAALVALHAGNGHTHLSAMTSTLNISSMNHVTFKTWEQEVGKAAERICTNSCAKFIQNEKENVLKGNYSYRKGDES